MNEKSTNEGLIVLDNVRIGSRRASKGYLGKLVTRIGKRSGQKGKEDKSHKTINNKNLLRSSPIPTYRLGKKARRNDHGG